MINAATLANLRRKSAYVDQVQVRAGVPLPSWIDLNLTELCNRSAGSRKPCVFCPRIDPSFYPNQKLHMSLELVGKIGEDLRGLDYQGAVVLCGFGEPTLHPELVELVTLLHGIRVELVTNGDFLTPDKIAALYGAGVAYFVVSMYDGLHQIAALKEKFEAAGCADYMLRDRWHTEADSFGLKLTNRAGTVTVGNQDKVDTTRPCHYLAYQLTVDWNGDVLLCVQDWTKRTKFGNLVAQSIMEVWTGAAMQKRRQQLIDGRRVASPCSSCNTDGTLHGFNHVPAWRDRRPAAHVLTSAEPVAALA